MSKKSIFFVILIMVIFTHLSIKSSYASAWLLANNTVSYQLKGKSGTDFAYNAGASVGYQPFYYFAFLVDASTTISNNNWGMSRYSISIVSQRMLNPKTTDYYPYIGVGVGFISAKDTQDISGQYERYNLSGIGINVPIMVGINLNIQKFLINFDVRYIYSSVTLADKYSNYSRKEDLSSFTASIGVGYIF